jgi:hypothetical protein
VETDGMSTWDEMDAEIDPESETTTRRLTVDDVLAALDDPDVFLAAEGALRARLRARPSVEAFIWTGNERGRLVGPGEDGLTPAQAAQRARVAERDGLELLRDMIDPYSGRYSWEQTLYIDDAFARLVAERAELAHLREENERLRGSLDERESEGIDLRTIVAAAYALREATDSLVEYVELNAEDPQALRDKNRAAEAIEAFDRARSER